EDLDPVRYLTNRSSGKQGYALAQAALDAGATVTLITAARGLPDPVGAQIVSVSSAESMLQAVLVHSANADILIMAAAVADFRPARVSPHKIKKSEADQAGLTLELVRTPDILAAVNERRALSGFPRVVVGFAAESDSVVAYARAKLIRKGLDLIAANDITAPDAGFDVETNRLIVIGRTGEADDLGLLSKARAAEIVIARAADLLHPAAST
ncbi:MAG: phosphopantothenoylcysteine decarboxylase, partial [Anaerolinea sp.]|nr:phosphopantothenoylcysteine decarboxylase [Anaerolinea sp.]